MSLLAGLDKLVSDVAGPLVFQSASLLRASAFAIDADTGQLTNSQTTEQISVIEADYTDRHRASLDIPDQDRRIQVLGYGVTVPRPGDRISVRGFVWEIVDITRDPAGALYDCQVKPITPDLDGDQGASLNALTDLPSLVADVAGPLLFGDATIFRGQTFSLDANGQAINSTSAQSIKALEVEYSAFHRTQSGIPETDRNLMVLGDGLEGVPVPGDRIDIGGLRYEIVRTGRDPARAVYECQSRPVGLAEVFIYARHAGVLPAITGTASGVSDFAIHAGVLPAITGAASASVSVLAVAASAFEAITGTATGETLAEGDVVASGMPALTGTAAGAVSISGVHAGALSPIVGGGLSGLTISAAHAGAMAAPEGTATGTTVGAVSASHAGELSALQGASAALVAITGAQAGILAPMDGAGLAAVQISATASGLLPALVGAANAGAGAGATQAGSFPALQGTGQATNAVTGQSGAIMAAMSGTGLATVAIQAIQSGAFPALTGTASGTVASPAISATHAGTLPAIIGAALAQASIVSTQTGAFPAITGSALAEASIVGTQTKSLPAVTGSATGEVEAPAGRTTPTLRSVTSSEESLTFTKPAGTVAGDILIGFWTDFGGSRTITPPAGWTAIGSTISHGGDINFRAAYKVAGGSEPSSYTATQSTGNDYPMCICFAVSGADTSAPVEASATSTGTSSNASIPSVTAANDNSFLVGFIHGYTTTTTPPSGMTLRANEFTTLGFTQAPISAGATGAKSTGVSNGLWGSIGVVINGAPS